MCGIIGACFKNDPQDIKERMKSALLALKHRGPDDRGIEYFKINDSILALGHTRLSIIDLSQAGHQPMHSADGRYCIIYNGEIYNYRELKNELKILGYKFKSESDTEVLLYAWIEWKEKCLKRLVGMFAFAIYDKFSKTLTCVRDAFGIKPLYYSFNHERFVFGSEIKALFNVTCEKPKTDWQRSYDYLVFADYDSSERSFFDGIKHLLPGHIISFDINKNTLSTPQKWWNPCLKQTSKLSFESAVDELRARFIDNVRLHLRSDVPLGVALSGGIDSSSIACVVRKLEPDMPIHTFSYVARGSDVNEEKWIDCVNTHINATPHKVVINSDEILNDLDDIIRAQGEPFGGTTFYAQYRVYRFAKQEGITVILDGQGGDELLGGYNGYPGWCLLSMLEKKEYHSIRDFINNWANSQDRKRYMAIRHLLSLLLPTWAVSIGRSIMGKKTVLPWLNKDALRERKVEIKEPVAILNPFNEGRRLIEELYKQATQKGLPSLLRHGDRNSMRFSIESRVPFLTTQLTEFVFSLPENYLISTKAETKSILRKAMRNIVPDLILNRNDKIGFNTPEKEWLNMTPAYVLDCLNSSCNISILNPTELIKSYKQNKENKRYSSQVWRWLNYIKWVNIFNVDAS